jgi:FtsZ family, C-terminal domain
VSPPLNAVLLSVCQAKGIVFNIVGGNDLTLQEVSEKIVLRVCPTSIDSALLFAMFEYDDIRMAVMLQLH